MTRRRKARPSDWELAEYFGETVAVLWEDTEYIAEIKPADIDKVTPLYFWTHGIVVKENKDALYIAGTMSVRDGRDPDRCWREVVRIPRRCTEQVSVLTEILPMGWKIKEIEQLPRIRLVSELCSLSS